MPSSPGLTSPATAARRRALSLALVAVAMLASSALLGRDAEAAAAPTIGNLTPGLGSRGGGTLLTISGSNFAAGATVTVGGAPATGVSVVTASSITATTPAGTPGPALVVVTNTDGQSATLSGAFSYQEWPPTVASVVANSGTSLGGTTVTINGTNFVAGATASFGGTTATSTTFVGPTQLTAVTPAHAAGAVAVAVQNPDTQSSTLGGAYTYVAAPPPTITSVSPSSGTTGGGTSVTLTGTGFASGATVTLGGTNAAAVQFVSATQLTVTTPPRTAGPVAVVVRNPDTQTGTMANGYTFAVAPAPTVASASPKEGPLAGGTTVTLTGTGFLAGATVSFGGTPGTAVSIASPTSLTVTAPAKTAAGAVAIEVKNVDNALGTLAAGYAYLDKPTVTGVTPTSGPAAGGTTVKIAGSGFGSAPSVTFGGVAATSVTLSSATELSVVTPAGAGAVDVTVSSAGGDGTKTAAFTYTAAPTLVSASPLQGSTAGGTTVTITGTGLPSDAQVLFDGVAGTGVTVATGGASLTVKSPAHAAGSATIALKLADGTSISLATPFTYTAAATPGQIVSGKVTPGSIALVVFSGGTSDQLITAATGPGACPAKDRLIFFALVEGKWLPFIPVAPAQVNAQWNARFGSSLPADLALFVRCT